jgi:hypothetical protein
MHRERPMDFNQFLHDLDTIDIAIERARDAFGCVLITKSLAFPADAGILACPLLPSVRGLRKNRCEP